MIKVERPGEGDATRAQLRDIPGVDSLYFTMLNHNKRSVTINTNSPQGMKVMDRLVATCDVLVENFAPGALDHVGHTFAAAGRAHRRGAGTARLQCHRGRLAAFAGRRVTRTKR